VSRARAAVPVNVSTSAPLATLSVGVPARPVGSSSNVPNSSVNSTGSSSSSILKARSDYKIEEANLAALRHQYLQVLRKVDQLSLGCGTSNQNPLCSNGNSLSQVKSQQKRLEREIANAEAKTSAMRAALTKLAAQPQLKSAQSTLAAPAASVAPASPVSIEEPGRPFPAASAQPVSAFEEGRPFVQPTGYVPLEGTYTPPVDPQIEEREPATFSAVR
jgi:hypothetical protein